MKFICPRCQSKLNLPEERVPAAGAWARCPKCQERFFLKVKAAEPAPPGPAAGRPHPAGRTAEEQKLLDRQRAKMGRPQAETSLEGPAGLGEVVVFPTPAPNYRLYGLAAALAVGGLLGFLAQAFRSAGGSAGPEPVRAAPPLSYEDRGLVTDLNALRRDFSRRSGLSRNVNYGGREARVYKYCMSQLAPRACDGEFSILKLRSSNTREGFRAVGVCLDNEDETAPELEINWRGRVAMAGVAGARPLEIPLASAGAGEAP